MAEVKPRHSLNRLVDIQKSSGKQKVYSSFLSVYRLKQAPRMWNFTVHDFLLSARFSSCPVERRLYVKESFLLLLDGVLCFAKTLAEIQEFNRTITASFSLTIGPQVQKFLGLEICEVTDGIILEAKGQVQKLIATFGLETTK